MEGRRNGALISMEQGKAVAFAIFNLQARGEMFVTHNDPVYPDKLDHYVLQTFHLLPVS